MFEDARASRGGHHADHPVAPETRTQERLVDDSAGAMVKQLGDALTGKRQARKTFT